MDPDLQPYADLIARIEVELRGLGVWQSQPPSPEALGSLVPFCYDTLEFTEWLQWVFIPRTRAVLERGEPMPTSSAIKPLAEDSFKELTGDTAELLTLIGRFDDLIDSGGSGGDPALGHESSSRR